MKLIVVEATIGAGKSTVLSQLAEKIGYTYLLEPVDSDSTFAELLKDFTQNPTDTAIRLKFQRYITDSRSSLLKDIPDGNYLIERSLFSDLVFSQVNMLGMERPDGEYISYYYDIINRLKDYPRVDAVVYLRTTPEIAHSRMMSRGRDAENGTPLSYMQDLHNYHEACLPQICREYNSQLLTFEWDDFGGKNGVNDIVKQLTMRGIVV